MDHLKNVRLSYTDADGNGSIDPATEIVEENNYYVFGLKHKGYNGNVSPLGNSVAKKWKYNGKELDESLGLNMYDYGARFYDPSVGRWFTPDALAEKYYDQSTYTYAINNPVIYIDPDGNAVEMCCDGAAAFLMTMVDNAVGSDLRNKYDTGSQEYRGGKIAGHSASLAISAILTVGGTDAAAAGGFALAASLGASATGVAAPVGVPAAGVSAVVTGIGLAAAAEGFNMMGNTVDNMKSDAQGNGSSSNKTGKGRGSNNRTADPDANGGHTVVNENGSTTYKVNQNNPKKNNKGIGFETEKRVDYKGAAHVDRKTGVRTPTPHVQEKVKGIEIVRPAIPGKDMPINILNN